MTVSAVNRPIDLYEPPPVFNKRLFKAQAGIVLTEEILQILVKPLREQRITTELHKLKSVVSGLKDVHKDLQYIKDALCYVVTYEKVDSGTVIKKKRKESVLSCYYILSGSVEAKYTINNEGEEKPANRGGLEQKRRKNTETRSSVSQENKDFDINYTHVAGDYLGLVSGDGPQYDLPPPDSIRTMEISEFLRIDREKFHQAVRSVQNRHVQEIEYFINHGSVLKHLPSEERANLVPLMAKQEYPAGKVIINQGDIPEHIFFVGKGRCQYFRRVYIGEARRLELVKLGQIEKGGFFGESTLLGGSPCFCSVTSIGPVTCYLINKWTIKTNESVLKLLRDNQHYFHEDEMIKHFIHDSDVWQSYKRRKIVELLEGTDKQLIVPRDDVPMALATAVEFGDAKMRHSNHTIEEKEPGEPKREAPLFVTPRSRRRSSAILQCSAAAVVKAVLLLRRNTYLEDAQVLSNNETSKPKPVRLPKVSDNPETKYSRAKPISAPGRYRTSPRSPRGSPRGSPIEYRSKSVASMKTRTESPTSARSETGGRDSSSNSGASPGGLREKKSFRIVDSKVVNEKSIKGNKNESVKASAKKAKSNTQKKPIVKGVVGVKKYEQNNPDAENHDQTKATTSSIAMEKLVTLNRNFILKEVINTGVPGKRISPPSFKRFQKSMFEVLDKPKLETETNQFGPSPWSISFAANKWMSSIRKQRLSMRSLGGQRDSPSPTQTPLIVIEEYAPEFNTDNSNADEAVFENNGTEWAKNTEANPKAGVPKRISSTPSPALEELREENEEEIMEYEKHEVGKPVEERWYTPIHEARDQSECHLQRVKKELVSLKKERDIMRRQQNMTDEEKAATDGSEAGRSAMEGEESVDGRTDDDSEESESRESSGTKESLRLRKHMTPQRQRSNTFTHATTNESQISDMIPCAGAMTQGHILRSHSLSRLRRGTDIDNGINRQGVIARPYYSYRMINTDQRSVIKDDRNAVLTKNEKRRLLLLGKLGL